MTLFFDTIDSLNQFTLALDYHSGALECQHCLKQDQFVSHGFVYKNQHIEQREDKEPVGKRVLCSNRYGRSGCGRTLRLYLADYIPTLNRSTHHIAAFLLTLIAGNTIQGAYQQATNTIDPRNAYRWLTKCHTKLIDYRAFLATRPSIILTSFKSRALRLKILLPTIARLRNTLCSPFVAQYQLLQQRRFI